MSEVAAPEAAVETTPEVVEEPATETDWKAEARKWEARAKESKKDADANKSAAERLAEIEAANQTEAEKAATRAEAAEKRAAELEAQVLRAEIANTKGVPAALLTGSTKEELEAAADALIEFRGEQKQTPSSPALGRVNGAATAATPGAQFESFLNAQIGR